ncbi:dihydroorotase [Cyanobium sp. HWJ4-Hawea]|uniref:dihydroorotase n=1 Tax=Cyanobium sp. HWJ4-Hawea TaxID=2823713 RepID=UPI0020CF11C0|nr:dihydroorotase [Cyanobium sp. HWJ4-Hawea]MCP9809626.1 dihydroorotase [Cyanobium sp. HWJ4-Hawea]
MNPSVWLRQLDLLRGPDQPTISTDALLDGDGALVAWGEEAAGQAQAQGLRAHDAQGWLLAPSLVDPHSVLEDPFGGRAENLTSLEKAAAAGGFGTVALLPWGPHWRDRPERLGLKPSGPMQLKLWGSFSCDGLDQDLAPQAEQLAAGAVGLAGADGMPPLALLERGLTLGDMADAPLLVAPRQAELTAGGFVRESVQALRSGWPGDLRISESFPLQSLLALASAHPQRQLVLMNLSTAEGVALLRQARPQQKIPAATVSWWHLVSDSGNLDLAAEGWRVVPSLGAPPDRQALLDALAEGLITAVAVHHLPLDGEEHLLPIDQRRPGVAGHGAPHGLVLPLLWQELVVGRGWSAAQLWQVLSWGGSELLGQQPEQLTAGSKRWLLFDPCAEWDWQPSQSLSLAANQPFGGSRLRGLVRASGLTSPADWALSA